MKTVKLITCDDAFQAHVIQGALKNEGIASVLHNENMSSVMRGYVRDVTGVDIFVYEDEYDNALRLLERNQMIPEQLRYCPHCGSDEIKFVLKKSHRVRAVVLLRHCRPHLRALSIGSMYAGSAALILRSRWRKEQLKNNQVFILLTAFQSSPGFYVPIGFPQNPGKPMCLLYGLG